MWIACVLTSAIWLMVALYKLTHISKMTAAVASRGIPIPAVSLWVSIFVELSGAFLMITYQYIWISALMWIGFLIVATPIFHGKIIVDGQIDYSQFIQVGKNISIAGGLVAVLILDGAIPEFLGLM